MFEDTDVLTSGLLLTEYIAVEPTFFYHFLYPTSLALSDCFDEMLFISSFQMVFAKSLYMRCADISFPASQTVSASDFNHSREFSVVM
jgi:hypothetical protein